MFAVPDFGKEQRLLFMEVTSCPIIFELRVAVSGRAFVTFHCARYRMFMENCF
jgi:hypothetical protein